MVNRGLAEVRRLQADSSRRANWKRWGPYLSERQWGTVREDYSADGDCWAYFPHEHSRFRAYRWGEDGLLGITDRECRLCFALALWNGRDPILKERLFGLSNAEGNHGEDVKELYYYLDSTPTHSYMKALYKYPQGEFPYDRLVSANGSRGRAERELEINDTGAFDDGRYFDVFAEYAKAAPDDILIRITVINRGPDAATLHLLPTLWFRNTWSWGCLHDGCWIKPRIWQIGPDSILTHHATLPPMRLVAANATQAGRREMLFTENQTNFQHLYGTPNASPFTKDAFHRRVILQDEQAVNPKCEGTKAAILYELTLPAGRPKGDTPASFRGRHGHPQSAGPRLPPHLLGAHCRGRCVLRRPHPVTPSSPAAPSHAPGVCGAALVQAVLSLRRRKLAQRRSRTARASAPAPDRPKP